MHANNLKGNRMQKLNLTIVLTGLVAFSAVAGSQDFLFKCSTSGVDTYADGTRVVDGECYALVYTEKGGTFQGFQADGRARDSMMSYVALAGTVARNGRCPPTLFQVLEENAAARTNGVWELFLLDTRAASGKPAGMSADGRLQRVNAWRRVNGRILAKRGTLTAPGAFEEVAADASPARLMGGTGVPPVDAPKPRITGIRVEGGTVKLTVADTVPYMTYDVKGAATPRGWGRDALRMAREPKDGRADGTITLEVVPRKDADATQARFFKVVRR